MQDRENDYGHGTYEDPNSPIEPAAGTATMNAQDGAEERQGETSDTEGQDAGHAGDDTEGGSDDAGQSVRVDVETDVSSGGEKAEAVPFGTPYAGNY